VSEERVVAEEGKPLITYYPETAAEAVLNYLSEKGEHSFVAVEDPRFSDKHALFVGEDEVIFAKKLTTGTWLTKEKYDSLEDAVKDILSSDEYVRDPRWAKEVRCGSDSVCVRQFGYEDGCDVFVKRSPFAFIAFCVGSKEEE